MKKLLLTIGLLLLTSCSSTPQIGVTTISSVVKNIRNDLQKTETVSVNNYDNWTNDQRVQFDEMVSEQQCDAKNPDPLISVFNDNFTMVVSGSFTRSGQFGITSSTSINLSASGSASKTNTQQITVPVNFIALSSLPNFEMNKKITLENSIISGSKTDTDIAKTEENKILIERDNFQKHIQLLITSYNTSFCLKNNYNNNGSFVTIKRK